MTVGSFLCDEMATLLHKKTCKSLMTLTCQAEDDCFIFRGTQWFTLWNLIGENPCIIHRHLPLYLKILFAKLFVSKGMFGPTVTKYLNLLHFKPEKRTRVGSGHYDLVKVHCISYQEILVQKT